MTDAAAFIDSVDARSRLAGSNKMEILVFSLGTGEHFGINVFKVREVTQAPPITPTPGAMAGVRGVISLRGSILPVLSLAERIGLGNVSDDKMLIVTEFSGHTQGFLVADVDRIIRVDWEKVKPPSPMLLGADAPITAVTELPDPDNRLVSILDVEKIMADIIPLPEVPAMAPVHTAKMVFFADDSSVARHEITKILDGMGVAHSHATDGKEAWDLLCTLATRAEADGQSLSASIGVILTDAEMPEMDGYVLTRNVKGDPRFTGIPVIMHSSLSSAANRAMGNNVGVDGYVAKFEPTVLAETLRPYLSA